MDENLRRVFDQARPSRAQKQAMLDRLLEPERKGKPMKKLKKLTVFAVAAALMAISAAAANPEGVQRFLGDIASVVQVGQYRKDMTNVNGETVAVFTIPDPSVENRNGRAILVIDGKDAADITDALAQDQHYVFEDFTEDTRITITVDGTIEKWTLVKEVGIVKADGSYHRFGSDTVTSETVDDALGGIFFNGDIFKDSSVDVSEGIADAEVVISTHVTTTDKSEAEK